MEESEKRRERLKAMRAAAACTSEVEEGETLIKNGPLANPLVDYDSPNQILPPPPALPRFDFYTDPLAAFSSHKHPLTFTTPGGRNSEMSQTGGQQNNDQGGVGAYYNPSNSATLPYHAHQVRVPSYSPRPGGVGAYYNPSNSATLPYHAHQVRVPSYSPRPVTAPIPFRTPSPFPLHQGTPSSTSSPNNATHYHYNYNNNPSPGLGRGRAAYPDHQGCGASNLRPHTLPRDQWPNTSPRPSSGRGCGPSDGSGYFGGRGRGGNAYNSQPRSYYDKSMLEDPWKFLQPVFWQSVDDDTRFFNTWGSVKITSSTANHEPHANRTSFRTSSSAKKPRVSNTSSKTSSEPSLAEFLAAAADQDDGDNS